MLVLQNISYTHPNKDLLFNNINLVLESGDKTALIGHNGTGKSTLLKIIAGDLQPAVGLVKADAGAYLVPQIFGQFDHLSVASALGIDTKLAALTEILNGNADEKNFTVLDDDWSLEERCKEALSYWQLDHLDLSQKLGTLSGGQKTKVFLSGTSIRQAELVLLDEPSNHLDLDTRASLYRFIESTTATLLAVSHDRKLLNLLSQVYELKSGGITVYGGNYDFYARQKELELNALNQDVKSKEKSLRTAREKEREAAERQNKLDNRGKKKQTKAGVARIMMNTLKNNAENSTSKLRGVHAEKVSGISQQLQDLRSALPAMDQMKFGFDDSDLHTGKILFSARNINISYGKSPLWKNDLSFQLASGERVLLRGANGSGKTTLIKIILGKLLTGKGSVSIHHRRVIYVDQDYSLIDRQLKVYEQAEQFNATALQEHEVKIRLNRFLFGKETWDKPCSALSGGEKMRLMLCCLTIANQSPEIIVLDEPTNNLDMQNIEVMITAIKEYKGTLIVVSHDEYFLEEVGIGRLIELRS